MNTHKLTLPVVTPSGAGIFDKPSQPTASTLPRTYARFQVVALGMLTLKVDAHDETAERFVVVDLESGELAADPALCGPGFYDNREIAAQAASDAQTLCLDAPPAFELAVTISTAHLEPATCARLLEGADFGLPVYPNDYGCFFVITPVEIGDAIDAPQSLAQIADWARTHNFAFVKIDADGPVIPDLPVYDHS